MSIEDQKVALMAAAQELLDGPYGLLSGVVSDGFERMEAQVRGIFGGSLSPAAEEAIGAIANARGEVDNARTLTAAAADTLEQIAHRLGT